MPLRLPHAPLTPPHPQPCRAVRLFELRFGWHEQGWVQKQLLEAWEFEGAALEFGDAARCTEPAARGAAARAEEAAEPAVQIA